MERIQEAGIEVDVDKSEFENRLAWLKEVNIALEMLDEDPIPIQMGENDLKKEKPANRQTENILQLPRMNGLSEIEDMQDTPSAISSHTQLNGNTIQIQSQAFFSERFSNLKNEKAPLPGTLENQTPLATTLLRKYNMSEEKKQEVLNNLTTLSAVINNTDFNSKDFLTHLKTAIGLDSGFDSNYIKQKMNGSNLSLRFSDHNAHAFNGRKHEINTSVVIKLGEKQDNFKGSKVNKFVEFVYEVEKLSIEEKGILLYKSDIRGLIHVFDERSGTSNIFLENGKLPDRIESDVAFGKNEKSAKFFWNNHNIRLDGESSTYDIMKDAHGGMYRRYYAKEKYEA